MKLRYLLMSGLCLCGALLVSAQNKILNSPARKLQLAEFAIANLYVDDVDEDKLVEDAIINMLENLIRIQHILMQRRLRNLMNHW